MKEPSEAAASLAEKISYGVSGSITLAGIVDALDHHAWIIGLIGVILTAAITYYFKRLEYRLKLAIAKAQYENL